MRTVTRNIKKFDLEMLTLLPVPIKAQMLRNVTSRGDGYGFCDNPEFILALLHKELVQLDLTACPNLDGPTLQKIVTAVPNLRDLRIAQPESPMQLLRPEDLVDCVSRLPDLRAFYVSRVDAVTDIVIYTLGQKCPRLSVLDVSNCRSISDVCGRSMRTMHLNKINLSHTKVSMSCLR